MTARDDNASSSMPRYRLPFADCRIDGQSHGPQAGRLNEEVVFELGASRAIYAICSVASAVVTLSLKSKS
jgi:hypothetical protein